MPTTTHNATRLRPVIRAAIQPATSDATKPITSLANSIGSVNVSAFSTAAYSAHSMRNARLTSVATTIHAANPAMTPRIFLTMLSRLEFNALQKERSRHELHRFPDFTGVLAARQILIP